MDRKYRQRGYSDRDAERQEEAAAAERPPGANHDRSSGRIRFGRCTPLDGRHGNEGPVHKLRGQHAGAGLRR